MKIKWLSIIFAAVLSVSNSASAVTADLNQQYGTFKKEREQKLLQIVKTYTPEKVREWEAALKKRSELKEKLPQRCREKHKNRPKMNHPDRSVNGEGRGRSGADWQETLRSKDQQAMKDKLGRLLSRIQQHNTKMQSCLQKNPAK
ncbi:hypothetical protein GKZ89_10485 [Bacillus mangrovi]|uniref:Uncharacterized protein n=1 Tax=Metabacillus mangrovi TaxID=1491830 RepID=A0A7X2S5Y3_9BACI|nr:hypothetical protein [Metabacillus mangrovi]MTH53831.1 hypothetical protein [Metabacillus mangrovi]